MSWAEEQDWFGLEDLVVDQIEEYKELLSKSLWKCANGNVVAIKDMTTSHIENCIKRMNRQRGWRKEYYPLFQKELQRRSGNVSDKEEILRNELQSAVFEAFEKSGEESEIVQLTYLTEMYVTFVKAFARMHNKDEKWFVRELLTKAIEEYGN